MINRDVSPIVGKGVKGYCTKIRREKKIDIETK